MKPLLVLGKVFLIGFLWSLFFIEGIRVILLINWRFDIFWAPHWAYLWELWHSGWVIDQAKEWAFILILLAAIPMWLTGWIFLSVINWKNLFDLVLLNPIRKLKSVIYDINAPVRNDLAVKRVVKKKSYKEIRPNMHGAISSEQFDSHPVSVALKIEDNESISPKQTTSSASSSLSKSSSKSSASPAKTDEKKPFTHSVFDFDDDDDDFDLDFDYAVKSIKKSQENTNSEPVNTDEYFSDYNDNYSEENFDDDDDDYRDKNHKSRNSKDKTPQKRAFDDFENDIRDDNFDEDAYDDSRRSGKKDKRRSRNDDFDDEFDVDVDFDQPKKREDSRRNKNSRRDNDERENRSAKRDASRNDRRRDSDRKSEQNRRNDAGNPIVETLRQKGYEIITGVNIKNTYIDYVAVDANVIYLCLVDKEVGDWLADEERFNDEEPLWFSETNHRISPVRLVDIARNILAKKLKSCKITFDLRAFVIVQNGNIINAEDMLEVWRGIDVDVTRINRGSPRELPLFSKSVEEVDQRIDSLRFESLKKLIRSIN